MPYHLSATKLQLYNLCPQAFYFRYECNLDRAAMFGSAALGTALHQALAHMHGQWHYQDSRPSRAWIHYCWQQYNRGLTPSQLAEGVAILDSYYDRFIATRPSFNRPVAVEGRIQASFLVHNVEFVVSGRYDRIDVLDDGLELIDYKSGRDIKQPDPAEVDLQLGLYCIALEQRYQRSLKRLSLIYLRSGEQVCFDVTAEHRQRVQTVLENLALELRDAGPWQPKAGDYCDRCAYLRYCPARQQNPTPLPAHARPERRLQLALAI